MCNAIIISGSWHCTAQPRRSPARRVSTCRKWLGIRLQETGISICTSSLGGHCGAGFLRSLRNMAADRGMMFCALGKENGSGFTVLPALYQHPLHTLPPVRVSLPSVSPTQTGSRSGWWAGQRRQETALYWAPPGKGEKVRCKRRWAGGIVDSAWT